MKDSTKMDLQMPARLMDALATTNERLVAFNNEIRTRIGVVNTKQRLDLRSYRSGPILEFFVEAELKNTESVCWWLDVQWGKDKWTIESAVLHDHDGGQDKFREFPIRIAKSMEEVFVELSEATTALMESTDCIDHIMAR